MPSQVALERPDFEQAKAACATHMRAIEPGQQIPSPAMVAQAQGQTEQAVAALQQALALARKLGLVSEEREIEALLRVGI